MTGTSGVFGFCNVYPLYFRMSSSQLEDYSFARNGMTIAVAVKPEMQQRSSFRVASKEAVPAASNLHQGNNSEEVTEEDDEEEAKESIQPILRRQENVVVQPSKSPKILWSFLGFLGSP